MTRISLKEAYDNRDVIAMLVNLRDDVDELLNILKDIDPNGDLTNVVTKTGDQIIDGRKTFIGEIVADCDIIQNGAAYETHAEQIYSHNDYLVMRDGQLNGLPAGSYSGLQVKKYNGSDDVRMVVDNTGIMRVGDINDEKPLTVRDEAADMTSGALVKWDGVNQKIITSSANIGDDTHPVKIVGGEPVAVTGTLQPEIVDTAVAGYSPDPSITWNTSFSTVYRYGNVVVVSFGGCGFSNTGNSVWSMLTGLPHAVTPALGMIYNDGGTVCGYTLMSGTTLSYATSQAIVSTGLGQIIYLTDA